MSARLSTCKSCADPIRWAVSSNGKRIPIDADAIIGGNIQLRGERAEVLDAEGQRAAAARREPLYVSHFATCAQAVDWRAK